MAGSITVSTISNDTGVFATQNGLTGIPKAWGNITGSTGAITNSFNVSSVTRNGTGDYTVTFTTAMANTNYTVIGNCQTNTASSIQIAVPWWSAITNTLISPTTSAFRISSANSPGAGVDTSTLFFAVLGN